MADCRGLPATGRCVWLLAGERTDLLGCQVPPFPDWHTADLEVPNAHADQRDDARPQGFHHAPDLAIAPFGDGHRELAVTARIANALHHGGTSRPVVEIDAVPN